MFKNLKLFIGILFLASAIAACDEGKYNDLSCDDSFKDECIAYDYFTTCQNNEIVTIKCPDANYCLIDGNGDSKCILARDETIHTDDDTQTHETPTEACSEGATQCNGNRVQICTFQQWVNTTTECENGCENGACL